jgi:N-methylhydantoinase B/oxoprolinase/acetone carboxylase alpha subunit
MSEHITKNGELAAAIYKNVKMGSDLIVTMMPKIDNQQLKADVTEQLASYEKYASKVKKMIKNAGEEIKEESAVSKFMAKMGIQMNTLTDSTTSHLAEMMIQGGTMGVTDATKSLREYENTSCSEDALDLAKRIIKYEENTIERLKEFLSKVL